MIVQWKLEDREGYTRSRKGEICFVVNVMPIHEVDGTICGYSGCLTTRYSRKDAHSSSDSVLRHQEDCTSGVEQVAEQLQKSGKIKT